MSLLSFRFLLNLTLPEHILAYVLASASNSLLLLPLSQFAAKAGQHIDVFPAIALHQLLLGVLIILLAISGMFGRTWRWQYPVTGILFAGYVASRMSTRFLTGLESINSVASQGISIAGDVPTLYLYGLAAAGTFTGMILSMRRAYGKLASARGSGPDLSQDAV